MFVWLFLFGYTAISGLRIRRRSKTPGLSPEDSRFLMNSANAILASTAGFFVGGAFIALALNDITWYTFALASGLDRISKQMLKDVATKDDVAARAVA